MKKYFTTGVALLLPMLLTILIIAFVINFLTRPFLEPTKHFISQFHLFHSSYLVTFLSKLLILLCLTAFIMLVGFLGQLLLIEKLFHYADQLLHRLPYINKIYKACQDVINTLFSNSSQSFSQVVLVPFPNPETLSVGLITKDGGDLISVYLPSNPNPTFGLLLFFKKEQLIYLNMTVDQAMKYVVSCGIMTPEWSLK